MLVGDTSVGKSCLIRNYLENSFSDDYEPTVLDIYKGTKNVKNKQIEIEIHDTSGDQQLGVNRATQYKGADVFMICVAVNSRSSYENIANWKLEISNNEPNKPIMVILTKSDLVDYVDDAVTFDEIKQQKEDQGFQGCSQTSSKVWEDFNVHKAFVQAICTGYYDKYELKLGQ